MNKKVINIMKNKRSSLFFAFVIVLVSLIGFLCVEKAVADSYNCPSGNCHETCSPSNEYLSIEDTLNCGSEKCCVKRECTLNSGVCANSRPSGMSNTAVNYSECKFDQERNVVTGLSCYLPMKESGKCKDGVAGNEKANCLKGTSTDDCKKEFGSSFFAINQVDAILNCIDEKGEGYICCASKEGSESDKCKGKKDGESCTTEVIGNGECKNEKCVKKTVEENACNKNGGTCIEDPCKDPFPVKVDNSKAQEACDSYNGEEGVSEYTCCKKDGGSINGATTKTTYGYDNPLGVNSLTEWIYNLLGSIQGIVGWLAVIMIVLGGVIYILSGGRESQTTLAKSIILWALVGFAIAVAAPALMKGIKDLIAGDGGVSSTDIIDNANSVKQIITNILTFLLGTIGVLALISFATGGLMYLFSGGDSKRTDMAKGIILYSIIAIAVSGAGVILLRQVMSILEASA